jgi:hypothetical protein
LTCAVVSSQLSGIASWSPDSAMTLALPFWYVALAPGCGVTVTQADTWAGHVRTR